MSSKAAVAFLCGAVWVVAPGCSTHAPAEAAGGNERRAVTVMAPIPSREAGGTQAGVAAGVVAPAVAPSPAATPGPATRPASTARLVPARPTDESLSSYSTVPASVGGGAAVAAYGSPAPAADNVGPSLTVGELVAWTRRGVSDEEIVDRIRAAGGAPLHLSAADEMRLRQNHVGADVIAAVREIERRGE